MKNICVVTLLGLLAALQSSCGYEELEPPAGQDYEADCLCDSESKSASPDHFWFVQITDIEQTRLSGSEIAPFAIRERGDYETSLRQLRYIHDVVSPQFVAATGDLVYGGILTQVPEQWEDYRMAVTHSCFDAGNFHDMPGNHDVMFTDDFDLYLAKSVSGKTHDAWTYENEFGRFAFISFNTSRPGKVDGYFSAEESDWLTGRLEQYRDYDMRVVFAHHSAPGPHMGDLFGPDGVLASNDVQAFFGGHIHKDSAANQDGTLVFQTDTTYAKDDATVDGRFRIVSLDSGSFATSSKWILHHGPQVLITYPQDRNMANSANPDGHLVDGITPIRALAFYENDVELSAYAGDEGPFPMQAADDFTHECEIDFSGFEPGFYTIRVQAQGFGPEDDNPTDAIEVRV